jgi:hypothetical protein
MDLTGREIGRGRPLLEADLRFSIHALSAGSHRPDEIFTLGNACVDDAKNMEGDEQQGAVGERAMHFLKPFVCAVRLA